MTGYVLAIDQGTTSTRAVLFDNRMHIVAEAQQEFAQHYPHPGWVEHDPEDLWNTTVATVEAVLSKGADGAAGIAALGIANQRETVVVWDRASGRPIHNAIVWQDRRTAEACARLKADGREALISERTGLLADPYFSATKIGWLLDHVDGARAAAEAGRLAFGTVDTFLLWRLTGGEVHATDATNASRTLLYDIRKGRWDPDLLDLFGVPAAMLPEVRDNVAEFGLTAPDLFSAAIPITGMAGDQQAATVGQACFSPGMVKSTYGTGCFALLNTGTQPVVSRNRLLTTIAYQIGGKPVYALEGAIFVAGAAVQWLRDGLGLIARAEQSGGMAAEADPEQDVYLVPAFVGLGAPYWDASCRGAIFGLTRGTGPAEFARAALESVCYQSRDLLDAMQRDWGGSGETVLRVDGGMAASDWTMQCLADILGAPVERPQQLETTAAGAAYLAGSAVGFYPDSETFAAGWSAARRFEPEMDRNERNRKYAGWQDAVRRTLTV